MNHSRILLAVTLLLASCAPPPVNTADAIETAQGYLEEVAEWVETASEVAAVAEDLEQFRVAAEAEEWVTALSSLRGAVQSAEAAGLDVPDAVKDNLARAEAMLMLTQRAE